MLDIQHVALALGTFLTVLGIIKAIFEIRKMLSAWTTAREEAIAARTRHEDALAKMMLQFENNHGTSLLDKVEEGNREVVLVKGALEKHVEDADRWFLANNLEHKATNRRIDGMYELLATPVGQHRIEETGETREDPERHIP